MANLNTEASENLQAVLIIGAGPTGLTLACELARRGIAFRLIEMADGPQPGSRGKGLQPRSLEVFDDLGIIDRVMAHGQMAMPMQSTAPDGQVTLMRADLTMSRPDVSYAASVITPQWRVEEALRYSDFFGHSCLVNFTNGRTYETHQNIHAGAS